MTKKDKNRTPRAIDYLDDLFVESTASANEVTGLVPTPPNSEEQAQAYEQLAPIHKQKPVQE